MHLRQYAPHSRDSPRIMGAKERGPMNITIEEQPSAQTIGVAITCRKVDRTVLGIVARLRVFDRKITGTWDGSTRVVNAEDVLYIESVDKRTFFYTADGTYETPLRLYEMEERLADCDFMRVSRGCVVNFRKIVALKPELNGRIVATLEGGDRVVVSRQYAPDIRHKLGLL